MRPIVILATLLLSAGAHAQTAVEDPNDVPFDERWSPGVGPGGAWFAGAFEDVSVATMSVHFRRDQGQYGSRWTLAAFNADTELTWSNGVMLLGESRVNVSRRYFLSAGAGVGTLTTHWKHVEKNRGHIAEHGDRESGPSVGLWFSPASFRFGRSLEHEVGMQLMVIRGKQGAFPGGYLSVAFHPRPQRRWLANPRMNTKAPGPIAAVTPAPASAATPIALAATPTPAPTPAPAPAASATPAPSPTPAPVTVALATPPAPKDVAVGTEVEVTRRDGSVVSGTVTGVHEKKLAVLPFKSPIATSIPFTDIKELRTTAGEPAIRAISPATTPAPAVTPAPAAAKTPVAVSTPSGLVLMTKQGARPVRIGERLEVIRTDGTTTRGTVTGVSNGKLALLPDKAPMAIAIPEAEISDVRVVP